MTTSRNDKRRLDFETFKAGWKRAEKASRYTIRRLPPSSLITRLCCLPFYHKSQSVSQSRYLTSVNFRVASSTSSRIAKPRSCHLKGTTLYVGP